MRLLTFVSVLLFAAVMQAQQIIVVPSAWKVAWDYDDVTYISHFNLYLSRTDDIVPGTTMPLTAISYPTKEWPIAGQPGRWFVGVTAVTNEAIPQESALSETKDFVILGPPRNIQIVPMVPNPTIQEALWNTSKLSY
jgi:hypothetical protein